MPDSTQPAVDRQPAIYEDAREAAAELDSYREPISFSAGGGRVLRKKP